MNKLINKTISLLLIIILILTNIPIVHAEDSIIKSNTATNLDADFDTKITLSLNPEVSEKKTIDIVLVVDAAALAEETGKNFVEKAYKLVDDLNNQKNYIGNIAIVTFGNDVQTLLNLTNSKNITSSKLSEIITSNQSWINNNVVQSNLQKGLLRTKEILDNSTTGSKKEDRHIILLTDGSHITYNNKNGETASAVYQSESHRYLTMSNMDSNGDVGSTSRNTKTTNYLAETNDYKKTFEKLMLEIDTAKEIAANNYKWKAEDNTEDVERLINAGELKVYKSVSEVTDLNNYPFTSIELGTMNAASTLLDIQKDYSIHTIGYLYQWGFNDTGDGYILKLLALPSISFVKWTENVGTLHFEDSKTISKEEFDKLYNQIENEIIPSVEKSTYLITEMGFGKYEDGSDYEFDFVNDIKKMSVKVLGESLEPVEIEKNVYGFGEDSTATDGYRIILRYYPSGIRGITNNESLKIDINYDYDGGTPIEIEYHEVLTEASRKNVLGTYGKYDEDGSEELSSLRTSNSTILYLPSGKEEKFHNPNLSYEVLGSSKNPYTGNDKIVIKVILLLSLLVVFYFCARAMKTKRYE